MASIKPAQAPIYRATERLLLWAVPIMANLPKSMPYQTLGGLLIRDLRESLDAIIMAMQTTDQARLECIDILIARMTAVKTTMRTFVSLRKISLGQEAQFLDLVNPIAAQAGGWRAKTMAQANIHG